MWVIGALTLLAAWIGVSYLIANLGARFAIGATAAFLDAVDAERNRR